MKTFISSIFFLIIVITTEAQVKVSGYYRKDGTYVQPQKGQVLMEIHTITTVIPETIIRIQMKYLQEILIHILKIIIIIHPQDLLPLQQPLIVHLRGHLTIRAMILRKLNMM